MIKDNHLVIISPNDHLEFVYLSVVIKPRSLESMIIPFLNRISYLSFSFQLQSLRDQVMTFHPAIAPLCVPSWRTFLRKCREIRNEDPDWAGDSPLVMSFFRVWTWLSRNSWLLYFSHLFPSKMLDLSTSLCGIPGRRALEINVRDMLEAPGAESKSQLVRWASQNWWTKQSIFIDQYD